MMRRGERSHVPITTNALAANSIVIRSPRLRGLHYQDFYGWSFADWIVRSPSGRFAGILFLVKSWSMSDAKT